MSAAAKEIYMYILGAIMILGELFIVGFLLYIWKAGASTVDQNVINLVYGMSLGFHSGFMLVLGYFYGSSKSSADKTVLLSEKKATTEQDTTQ